MKRLENKKEAVMEKIMEWSIEREKEKRSEYIKNGIKERKQRIEKNLKLLQEIKRDFNNYIGMIIEVRGAIIMLYGKDIVKLDILSEEVYKFMIELIKHKRKNIMLVKKEGEESFFIQIEDDKRKPIIIDGERDFLEDEIIEIIPLGKEVSKKMNGKIKKKRLAIDKLVFEIFGDLSHGTYEISIRGTYEDVDEKEIDESTLEKVVDSLSMRYKDKEKISMIIRRGELLYIDRYGVVQITKRKY